MNKKNKKIIYPVFLLVASLSFAFLSGELNTRTTMHTADRIIEEVNINGEEAVGVASGKTITNASQDLTLDNSLFIYYQKEVNIDDIENLKPKLDSDLTIETDLEISVDGMSPEDKGFTLGSVIYSLSTVEPNEGIYQLKSPMMTYLMPTASQDTSNMLFEFASVNGPNKLSIVASQGILDSSNVYAIDGSIVFKQNYSDFFDEIKEYSELNKGRALLTVGAAYLPPQLNSQEDYDRALQFSSTEVNSNTRIVQEKRKVQ